MTKGLQVSDEVIRKGVEFQKGIDRAEAPKAGVPMDIEVPNKIPNTSQSKANHLG